MREKLKYGGRWVSDDRFGTVTWEWVNEAEGDLDAETTKYKSWWGGSPTEEELTNPGVNPKGKRKVDNPKYTGEFMPDGSRNKHYVPVDVNVPTLTRDPGWPRDITGKTEGMPPPGSGNQTPGPPPSHAPFAINIASGRETIDRLVHKSDQAHATYERLKNKVASEKGWIFSVRDEKALTSEPGIGYHEVRADDGSGTYHDPHPELTAQMSASMDNLLLAIADAITAVGGSYVGTLNNALQLYAKADQDSRVPEN